MRSFNTISWVECEFITAMKEADRLYWQQAWLYRFFDGQAWLVCQEIKEEMQICDKSFGLEIFGPTDSVLLGKTLFQLQFEI